MEILIGEQVIQKKPFWREGGGKVELSVAPW